MRLAFTANDIVWLQDHAPSSVPCPVCGNGAGKRAVLRTPSLVASRPITLFACPDCDCLFWDDLAPPAYEDPADYPWAIDFYVEQGAAIDALIEPVARLAGQSIKRTLEIGCGYGFSLDAGHRLFGWEVLGVDPSPLAAAGSKALGIRIDPIYADADTDLGGAFGLVYGSEVIEHVADPNGFLRICRAHLAPDGILALTTPDAACIRPDTDPAMLLPALSPGHHLILFSAHGLKRTLERAGFSTVSVRADGPRLIAYAANRSFDFDPLQPLDRRLYRAYLEAVLDRPELPSALRIGLSGRLLKECSHAGDFDAAAQAFDRFAALVQETHGIAVTINAASALAARIERTPMAGQGGVPWCLPPVYFCRGMMAMNHEGRHADAIAWFDGCARLAAACRTAYATVGIEDGETSMLMREAKVTAIFAQSFVDPALSFDRLQKLEAEGTVEPGLRRRLILRFIDLGHFDLAERTALETGDDAAAALARGFIALHREGQAATAKGQFDKALAGGDALQAAATRGLLLVGTVLDPDFVVDRAEAGGIEPWLLETLFTRLVDLGHAAQARRLAPLLADRDKWQILSRIGLLALLETQPGSAIDPLARAFALARAPGSGATEAECCQMKEREVLAHLLMSNVDGAAQAAFAVLGPGGRDWVPPEAKAALEALLAHHPAVRAALSALAARSVGLDRNAGRAV